ncbi:hypothetical protein NBRC111894_2935 [Sporolactobacillus inulinus]|uniref:Uncharacterized protein n=1 Tax=Sporolactobacillus inulinus TaxID=2078 RepID=A0A4Y1ZEK0_9BACL|nr:hypothetical protein NBRC111894_2935 [Sporolactobacillus inulinus]
MCSKSGATISKAANTSDSTGNKKSKFDIIPWGILFKLAKSQ